MYVLLIEGNVSRETWARVVVWHSVVLRMLSGRGWMLLAIVFMAVVLALMRAAGKADNSDL